jgi:hypothetical protein
VAIAKIAVFTIALALRVQGTPLMLGGACLDFVNLVGNKAFLIS